MEKKHICVCVLGDIGHSPRMQYHSLSLAQSGFAVDIVGYLESKPHRLLLSNPDIKIWPVYAYKNIEFLPKIFNYILKVFVQLICLFFTFLRIEKPSHILVQNPPSIPALFVVWFIARLRGCKFVIDWHNYGYSILALSLSESHFFVRTYRWLEFFFGRQSDFAFCVSRSMQQDLKKLIGKHAIVLYDRPYSFFQPLTLLDKHNFLSKLQAEYPQELSTADCDVNRTLFTELDPITGWASTRRNAPIILVSSTSWTEDEDFQILLDALHLFDRSHADRLITNNDNPIKVVCVITGKGPLKAHYMAKLSEYQFAHTRFLFPWLTAEDYPKMLASANLGICLHKSSSGLDLPMKVVDMFGSRLPVCAFRYPSIAELVIENENGLLFGDSAELVGCLTKLFDDYPWCGKLSLYSSYLEHNFCQLNWEENWRQNALPIFAE